MNEPTQPKFVVVGFPKCGQNSLIEYLRVKYNLPVVGRDGAPLVTKSEFIWHYDAFEKMETWEGRGYKCVIIRRNPADRIWSSYNYFGYKEKMRFEEYLDLEGYSKLLGEENPIKQSNYDYWIKQLNLYSPLVFDLEKISIDPTFPTLNENEDEWYSRIPPVYEMEVLKRLSKP